MSAPLSREQRAKYQVRGAGAGAFGADFDRRPSLHLQCCFSCQLRPLLTRDTCESHALQVKHVPIRKEDEVQVVRGTYKVGFVVSTICFIAMRLGSCRH